MFSYFLEDKDNISQIMLPMIEDVKVQVYVKEESAAGWKFTLGGKHNPSPLR